jgi:hypothetical protein
LIIEIIKTVKNKQNEPVFVPQKVLKIEKRPVITGEDRPV